MGIISIGIAIGAGPYYSVPNPTISFQSDTNVTGNPVSSWGPINGTGTLLQGTAGSRPAVTASAFGTTQGLTFDGVDDIMTVAGVIVTSTAAGSLSVVFKTPATVTAGVILAQSDSAAANNWWELGIDSTGRLYVESNNAGTKETVEATTILEPSTAYNIIVTYDGVDFWMMLNGVEENPLFVINIGAYAWLGRVTAGTPVFSVGGTVVSGATARPLNFTLGAVYFWPTDITS